MQNLLSRDPSLWRLGRESRFLWHRLGGQEVTGSFPGRDAVEAAYLSEVYRGEHAYSPAQERRWALRCISQGVPAQYLDLSHDLIEELAGTEIGPFAGTVQSETAPFTLPPLGATFASDVDGPIRMVDKDTGHCWRIPALAQAFPDARFVFVVRNPVDAVRSLVAGWRHPTWFFTYRMDVDLHIGGYSDDVPWGRRWWNFNIFPGHESLVSASLPEVCAEQWAAAMRPVAEHGARLVTQGRATFVAFERLVAQPREVLGSVAEFLNLDAMSLIGDGLGAAYMSMAPGTYDTGAMDIEAAALKVRTALDPVAHLVPETLG